jgi:hypothetical protein
MFQKIIGIIGVLAVVGVVVMVALSPRAEGFYPDMFDFLERTSGTEEQGTIYAPDITVPAPDSVWTPTPQIDTLDIDPQGDVDSIK